MAQNSMVGSIPSQMGRLTNLKSLVTFSQNKFEGSIPTQIGNLLLMSSAMFFHENSFTGQIPTELKSLTALDEDFTLNDNDFCGTFASGDQLPPNLPNTFDVDTEVKVSIPNHLARRGDRVSGRRSMGHT